MLKLLSFVLNSAILGLIWLAYRAGHLETAWTNDTTYITPMMLVLAGVTYLAILRDTVIGETKNVILYDYMGYLMVTLGMTGTVFGFFVALSGVNPDAVGDVANVGPMVGSLIEGMGIALWTTLSGICLYIILTTNSRLIERFT